MKESPVFKHNHWFFRYLHMAPLKKTFLLFQVLLVSLSVEGQQFLSHFSLAEGGGKVVLNWTIDAGNTCFGIDIVRSTDGQTFASIGTIGGICGSIDEPVSYSFVDEAPVANQTNYYKLLLGLSAESDVLSIEIIDFGSSGYQIRPHPVHQDGLLYFQNDAGEKHVFSIYQLNGHLLSEQETSYDHFILDLGIWPAGLYPFRITDAQTGKVKAKGKLVHQ